MNLRLSRRRYPAGIAFAASLLAAVLAPPASAQVTPHAGMLRFPDISATHVVFCYANDLWLAPRDGGTAVLLASPPGPEAFPRFSPDGKSVAFIGNYEGNRDLYVVSLDGGPATRVTYHPGFETLCGWTPDGKLLFSADYQAPFSRRDELFVIPATGGAPEKLPIPYGTLASIKSDGVWLAYTPHSIDSRTWKRYRGGMATDIWLFNLKDKTSKRMTDWEGLDSQPMWQGDAVYYLSDNGPEHRLNIWMFDSNSGQRKQVTTHKDYDVKWPANGPGKDGKGEIVYQCGADLCLLDLATGQARTLTITIPGDRPKIRPQRVDAAKFIAGGDISSTGKRLVVEARGDIWTVPAKNGAPRNLTQTSGVAERDPSWSPDAQWIAYFSDATGEYELYVRQSDGKGEPRQLTKDGNCYRYRITWSPDSKHVVFNDKTGAIFVHTIDGGATKLIDKDPTANAGGIPVNWAPDSRWITYTREVENTQNAIFIYNVPTGELKQVTSGVFNDSWPTFDRKGDYLYFSSNRNWTSPLYEDMGTTFAYANTDVLHVVPLRAKVGVPNPPKSDEELWGEKKKQEEEKDKKKDGDKKDEEKKDAAASAPATATASATASAENDDKKADEKKVDPIEIELDGFERRAVPLPLKPGAFGVLSVNDEGKLIYVRQPSRGVDAEPSLKIFDPKDDEKKENTILDGIGGYGISADGKKLVVFKGDNIAIIDAKADQKMDKPVPTDGLKALVDPREEWKQIFVEAWRVQRDFFYDPNLHRVDWPAIRKQYEKMLPDCVSREDLSYIIREMISELNVGHAYYQGGESESGPTVSVGLLGCDYEWKDGAYQIARIIEGAPWDTDARGPLSRPGVDVQVGDYLLAVNGSPVDAAKDPWAAFQGLAGKTITITVSKSPKMDDSARDVVVEALGSEENLRFRNWIEKNRAHVADKTGGKVGYVYVPDTGVNGQNNLFRQFYGQRDKQALVVDERWNRGGQIPTRFIELLNRPATNYWARRDGRDWMWPPDSLQGPKCMLINGLAGSGGDAFPYYFRQSGLGKLIGMRTWGGLVGISGNPGFIDGTGSTAPTFGFYERDGTWGVEGHGVDPDIEVIDDPAKMQNGADVQLDAAITHITEELKTKAYVKPKRPEYPDRKGMGIPEKDH
ncbi:hypothetical protein RAS1_40500 [Phycisphaerae bacterium RAS1]|nr:hypothetical protein RAS1_40500 [Phycisphaerae bacterium RAS1]